MTLLSIHKISVLVFLFIYVVKTFLLLTNKTEALEKFKKMFRIPEMIVSTAFLVTGIWMLIGYGSITFLQVVKIVLVLASIPIAVIAYKKSNKMLAVFSLLLIVAAYGLAEINKTKKAMGTNETSLSSGNKEEMGKAIFTAYCVKCHGEDGKKGFMAAADLSLSGLDSTALIEIISNGRNGMKGYQKELSTEQIDAAATYVSSLRK